MKLPTLTEIETSRDMVQVFGGYNHNLRISDGEWYEESNFTTDNFPVMSNRKRYGKKTMPTQGTHKINGMIAKDALCYVDGTDFYVNDYKVTGLTLTDTPKQLVSMGAYVVIFPDKKWVNTAKITEFGDLEATYTSTGQTVTYTSCNIDGEDYVGVMVSPSEPAEPENRMLWIDSSETPHVMKQYAATTSVWVVVGTTYVKIAAPNIASSFSQWDGVKFTGISTDAGFEQISNLNGSISVLYNAYHDPGDPNATPARAEGTNDYLVVVGLLDATQTQSTAITVSRSIPKMDFVIESNNRLWGCRYGTNNDNEIVNEVYASKLGDFKNWNVFLGLSTDSYAASCGTDGQWTGAISHLGYPCFFKENVLHKVYGNFPSNYQIQTTPCRGVMKGAGMSLAIVNEVLYYKSRDGVCAYDGSLPREISDAFGSDHYTATLNGSDALRDGICAAGHDNKYYIFMGSDDSTKGWNLFVYDTNLQVWHKWYIGWVNEMCSCRNELYFVQPDITAKELCTMFGSGTITEGPVEWSAVTGIIGLDQPDQKTLVGLVVRMSLEKGKTIRFYAEYDSSEQYELITTITGTSLRTFTVPIRPRRCDHFRLGIVGSGDVKIYSITKTLEQGSDIYS